MDGLGWIRMDGWIRIDGSGWMDRLGWIDEGSEGWVDFLFVKYCYTLDHCCRKAEQFL